MRVRTKNISVLLRISNLAFTLLILSVNMLKISTGQRTKSTFEHLLSLF